MVSESFLSVTPLHALHQQSSEPSPGVSSGVPTSTESDHHRWGVGTMAFYELRQYRMRPGKRDAWVKLMEEEILPFQISKGMVIAGMFCGEEDKDLFVWLRRFESEAEREQLYAAVYDTDVWKNDIGPRVLDLIYVEQIKVTRMEATPRSVLR